MKKQQKFLRHTMLLLWMGAAISISEIYTGGMMAPLGYAKGLAVILLGHLIGTGLLAFGSYISFSRRENAMESVGFSLGLGGGKLAAFCNVVQLIGWTIVMVVQAGSAVTGALPEIPFGLAALILSCLVVLWALILGSPAGKLNEIVVILLALLCIFLFFEAARAPSAAAAISGAMSVGLGVELSIAMPVSWLPLAGDYAAQADSKTTAVWMPFAGYFLGSVLMYAFGLYISISSGLDIFGFIAASPFRVIACTVVLFSTLTTAFLDLYSAAVSSRQLVKTKNERLPILVIGVFAILVSIFFPVNEYEAFLTTFLTAIGMVFIPVYTVLFLDFILKQGRSEKAFRPLAMVIIILGMAGYRFFTQYEIWIPTLLTIALVALLYIPSRLLLKPVRQE